MTATVVSMSREEHDSRLHIAALHGMYHFWTGLKDGEQLPEAVIGKGDRMLRGWAQDVFIARRGIAVSEEDSEVFRYCGLKPRIEQWRKDD